MDLGRALDEHIRSFNTKPASPRLSQRLESYAIGFEIFPLYFDIAWRSWVAICTNGEHIWSALHYNGPGWSDMYLYYYEGGGEHE